MKLRKLLRLGNRIAALGAACCLFFIDMSAQTRPNVVWVRFRPGVAYTAEAAARMLPEGMDVRSQLLAPEQARAFRPTNALAARPRVPSALERAEEKLCRTFAVAFGGPILPERMAAALMSKQGVVEYAEPWYTDEMHAVPNDPRTGSQGYLTRIKAFEAWDSLQGDTNVVIGVSDNGVDQTHEDLRDNIWKNGGEIPDNDIDDDGNGYVDDYIGCNLAFSLDGTKPGVTLNPSQSHGTEVAGLAGATTNNGIGIAGSGNKCRFFPIKTGSARGGDLVYSYQSIVYAGLMRFKVLNCSWGRVKPFSPIDQSVIDYAAANDVVIVASAGNHGSFVPNYPSAYDNVLGVGETNEDDFVLSSSGVGVNADVMAPGYLALTTTSGNGYTTSGIMGTSFASPLAAGMCGLIRSRYPQLNAAQTIAFARRCTDDISENNIQYGALLPGRINFMKAVTTDPFSIPSVRIVSVDQRDAAGTPVERFRIGDTLRLTFNLRNELGPVTGLTTTLQAAVPNGWNVTILDHDIDVGTIGTGADVAVGTFRVVINGVNNLPLIFSLEMEADNYSDKGLYYLPKPAPITTFRNNMLAYTASDDGWLGFDGYPDQTRQGIGLIWKGQESLLSPSGLLFTEGGAHALKAYDNLTNQSDFTIEKPFTGADSNRAVMSDRAVSTDRCVGVRITQRHTFPSANMSAAVITTTVENTSDRTLTDISAGHFLDFDIGQGGSENLIRLAPEAIPDNFSTHSAAAEAFERQGVPVAVVIASSVADPTAEPQAVGMRYRTYVNDNDGLTDADVVTLLNSGTGIQTAESGDMCTVVGMKFPGQLERGAVRTFITVIGIGETIGDAAATVRAVLLDPMSVNDPADRTATIAYPQPASTVCTIDHGAGIEAIDLVDVAGRTVLHQVADPSAERSMLNLASCGSGVYRCILRSQRGIASLPFVIVR